MKKQEPLPLSSVLDQFLSEQSLRPKFNENEIIATWPKVLGPGMAQYTTSLYIRQNILYVQLSSSVLRNELMLMKNRLINQLNQSVGEHVINDIVFR